MARDEGFFISDAAATELELVVEEQEAGRVAGLNGKGGEGAMFGMVLQHAAEVDVAQHVDVVKEERF